MTDGQSGKDLSLRASHEDRDRVIEQLRVAAGDGRLSLPELDERIEQASAALTYAELVPLTADLPAAPAAPGAPPAEVKDLTRIECTSGHAKRDGNWVVPRAMEIKVRSGHVLLDFTQAVISQPTLNIEAQVGSGHLRIITKPGIVVDADEVAVSSGHVTVRSPWDPGVPAQLRIAVSGRVSSGHIMAGPRRRTFWQWLTRKPVPWAIPATRQLPRA
jgi:hypothetical protein